MWYKGRMDTRGKKVYVGLSGGVDSSVSAALLQEAGYDVTGVFIKVWSPDWMECTWREDRRDAMRVCALLGIPFITLDLEKEYKKEVVDYMLSEYNAGRTPNPDVMCNKYVKFGGFYDWARAQGADFVATGHYAQILKEGEQYKLMAGDDENKDQSYFLWTLTQEHIAHTLFPVGTIEKPEVRKLAAKFKLPTADKKDSQGLCFIGKVDMKEFLSHYIDQKLGNVLDDRGNVIGTHTGAIFYTIGERHGFTIIKKTPNDAPYYIIDKNLNDNTLVVSQKMSLSDELHTTTSLTLSSVNWIREIPKPGTTYSARIRYRQDFQLCTVEIKNNIPTILFEKSQEGVSIGQSLVLYDKKECVGGGIIETKQDKK
jgi:tRNA-uridine 2-sulfurtransferase